MKRILFVALIVACLGATGEATIEHPENAAIVPICHTRVIVCQYCGETYRDADLTDPPGCVESPPTNLLTIRSSFPIHPLVTFTLSDSEEYETCQVAYLRALVKLTGAKRKEPKP